jgi:hypothetical protein
LDPYDAIKVVDHDVAINLDVGRICNHDSGTIVLVPPTPKAVPPDVGVPDYCVVADFMEDAVAPIVDASELLTQNQPGDPSASAPS